MTAIRTIVFDIGNVLLTFNPRDFMHQLFQDAERGDACFSLMVKSQEWQELDRGAITIESAKAIFQERDPKLAGDVETFFQHWLEMFHPIEKNIKILDRLKEKGYTLIVLSNFIRESFEALQDRLTFLSKFDGFVVSYQVGKVKPNRDVYEHLLDQYDLVPSNACLSTIWR